MYFHNSLIPRSAYLFCLWIVNKKLPQGETSQNAFQRSRSINQEWKIYMLKWAYPSLTSQLCRPYFRCSEGLQGLREQGITNTIVRNFIDDYNKLFMDDDVIEDTRRQSGGSTGSSSKRIQVQAATSERSPPVIKRRGMRGVRKRVIFVYLPS